jgi:hypothetical protein
MLGKTGSEVLIKENAVTVVKRTKKLIPHQ